MIECKAICIKCRYHYYDPYYIYYSLSHECYFKAKEEVNCVTGNTYIDYTALCKDKNSKGECEDFEHIPKEPEPEVEIKIEPPKISFWQRFFPGWPSQLTYKYEWHSRTQRWVRTLDRVEEIDD